MLYGLLQSACTVHVRLPFCKTELDDKDSLTTLHPLLFAALTFEDETAIKIVESKINANSFFTVCLSLVDIGSSRYRYLLEFNYIVILIKTQLIFKPLFIRFLYQGLSRGSAFL